MNLQIRQSPFGGVVFIALLAFALVCFASSTNAEEKSLARQIAELIATEEAFLAIQSIDTEEGRKQIRESINQLVDTSSISDRDLLTLGRIQMEIAVKPLVVGIRAAFTQELEKLSIPDQQIIHACMIGKKCDRSAISASGKTLLGGLAAVGKTKGEQIGRAVGAATAPELIRKLEETDPGEFDDREALLRVLRTGIH